MLKNSILFSLVTALFVSSVNARNITDIKADVERKKQVVQNIAERFQRHQDMSLEQIKQDLLQAIETNKEIASSQKVDVEQVKRQIGEYQSKEEVLAAEKEFLDQAVSADCYLFGMTAGLIYSHSCLFGKVVLLPFALAIDAILLPFELIATLATGC